MRRILRSLCAKVLHAYKSRWIRKIYMHIQSNTGECIDEPMHRTRFPSGLSGCWYKNTMPIASADLSQLTPSDYNLAQVWCTDTKWAWNPLASKSFVRLEAASPIPWPSYKLRKERRGPWCWPRETVALVASNACTLNEMTQTRSVVLCVAAVFLIIMWVAWDSQSFRCLLETVTIVVLWRGIFAP